MDILRTMIVIQNPDGSLEIDCDMKGQVFYHAGRKMSRKEWMRKFRPQCKLKRVHMIAANSGTHETPTNKQSIKPCAECEYKKGTVKCLSCWFGSGSNNFKPA